MIKVQNSLMDNVIKEERSNRIFFDVMCFVFLFLSIFFLVINYLFVSVETQGPSMQPTIKTGDILLVNKYEQPTYGDIVIIDVGEKWLVKRVVGKGGDEVKFDDGYVYLNGEKIVENYVKEQGVTEKMMQELDCVTVPDGEYYYLGDNRADSLDSRRYGTCDKSKIIGVVENWSLENKQITSFLHKIVLKIKK